MSAPTFAVGTCLVCGRAPDAPYRRRVDGKIVEGCVARAHTTALHGLEADSVAWHNRPSARALRLEVLRAEIKLLGRPARATRSAESERIAS